MKRSVKQIIMNGLVCGAILVIDLLSKAYIAGHFKLFQSHEVIPNFFSITYIQNRGAAWSILEGQTLFLIGIAVIAGIAMIYYFIKSRPEQKLLRLGLAMVFAGMLGNLIDRVVLGYVRDFLDFVIFGYDFPVFNVADMGVTIGMAVIILQILMEEYAQWKYKKSMSKK